MCLEFLQSLGSNLFLNFMANLEALEELGTRSNASFQEPSQKGKRPYYKSGTSRGQGKISFARDAMKLDANGQRNSLLVGNLIAKRLVNAQGGRVDNPDANVKHVR